MQVLVSASRFSSWVMRGCEIFSGGLGRMLVGSGVSVRRFTLQYSSRVSISQVANSDTKTARQREVELVALVVLG